MSLLKAPAPTKPRLRLHVWSEMGIDVWLPVSTISVEALEKNLTARQFGGMDAFTEACHIVPFSFGSFSESAVI